MNQLPFRSHQQNPNWQSVADRISELERQHSTQVNGHRALTTQSHQHHQQSQPSHQQPQQPSNQKYTFIDPSKTTRVSNPALKAFQKNAVQSYFERHQLSAKEAAARQVATRPQSLPITGAITAPTKSHSRSSLPNNYSHSLSSPLNALVSPNLQQNGNSSPSTCETAAQQRSPHAKQRSPPITSSPVLKKSPSLASSPSRLGTKTPPPSHSPPMHSPATVKVLTSPSYQAVFHQSAATYIPVISSIDCGIPTNGNLLHSTNIGSGSTMHSTSISSKMIMVDEGFLQSANESGVPPPPPRRSRSMMPVRRFVKFNLINLIKLI